MRKIWSLDFGMEFFGFVTQNTFLLSNVVFGKSGQLSTQYMTKETLAYLLHSNVQNDKIYPNPVAEQCHLAKVNPLTANEKHLCVSTVKLVSA